jgi:Zn-dependent membrane protease YugP
MYYGFDPTVIYLVPAIVLAVYAEYKVNKNFKHYGQVKNIKGYTGSDVARQLLMLSGIRDVDINQIGGHLSDNYDPRKKTLNLSKDVFNSSSIAALGIAAHETGHAIQDQNDYFPLVLRNSILPLVSFSSKLSMPLIFIGLFLSGSNMLLLKIGIILFGIVVMFQIITLPVEFNASRRAVNLLIENNFLSSEEVPGVKKVLRAAALTYIAATASAIANLIRYLAILNNRDNRRD